MLQNSAAPQCLLLVRSTLEVAGVLKRVYPVVAVQVFELEQQVEAAGQRLLEAGSVSKARAALDTILQVRLDLEKLSLQQNEAAEAQSLSTNSVSFFVEGAPYQA